ncbi:MAG: ELWxxDGT repeat protein, partial [Planctomycetota bacterium]
FANLTAVDGVVYFAADDGEFGKELWMSDGTEAGTVLVADLNRGEDDNGEANSSFPAYLQDVDGTLYFSAFTPEHGRELWQSDGTAEGTVLVEDRIPGVVGSYPNELSDVQGTLFFSAEEDGAREVWMLADADDFELTIVVDGEFVELPANLGVVADDAVAPFYTRDDSGQVLFTPDSGATLGEFFDVWRTDAGEAGNNPDAVLSSDELLGNEVDFEHTVQMFVNGQLTTDFDEYVVQDDDEIVLVYGANPVVSINTNFGSVVMELFEEETPGTVANFLNYVNDGDYANSFFHRSDPGFVIQGGGFTTPSPTFTGTNQFSNVPTDGPIANEPGISNLRGTVAMAKIGLDPDSATSQFFVNLGDNSALDEEANNAFTVFGQVLGMTTVDRIASLPIDDSSPAPYGELPLGPDDQLVVVESIAGYGDVTGVKFADANGNGQQDDGELGLANVEIYVDANENGVRDAGEVFALTDDEGRYRLQLEPGTYTLSAALSPGAALATVESLEATVEIGRELSGLDFGEQGIASPSTPDLLDVRDSGVDSDDDVTSNNNSSTERLLEFTITGVVAGAEVRIYANDELIGSAVATSDTAIVATDGAATLVDGQYSITATQTLSDVEINATEVLFVTIDSTPPAPFTTAAPEFATVDEPFAFDVDSPDEGLAGVFYSLVDAPTEMTIDPATGQIAWTPGASDAVPQEFQILLTDAAGNATSQRIDMTVLKEIAALPDVFETNEDVLLEVGEGGVLNNDGDEASDVVSAELVTGPAHGDLVLENDGSFTYTPNPDFYGVDSFTYVGSDGAENTNVAKVTINVSPVQDPPAPEPDSYRVDEDDVLSVDASEGVLSNDVDVDGDALSA